MEEELKKENAPDEDTGKQEPQLFNRAAREAIEAAYQQFEDETAPADTTPPDEPPKQDTLTENTRMDVSKAKTVEETPPAQSDEWKPRFKDHRTAEESYSHAQKEMSRATTEADRLRKENAELVDMLKRIAAGAPEQTPGPARKQPPQDSPPPELDKEALEAELFKDPVGFLQDYGRAITQQVLNQAKSEIARDTRQQRVEGIKQAMTFRLQEHFDSTYPELKALEPLAFDFTEQVRRDQEFMAPLLKTIEAAPNELKARKIFEVSRTIMDEGAKRLKERLPDLVKPFGFQAGDQTIQKERLSSGSPPVVPGGSRGPVVKPSGETMGETQEEYMAGRRKHQDRMRMANSMR